jgi:outer membrane protein
MDLIRKLAMLVFVVTLVTGAHAQEKAKADSILKFSLAEAQKFAVENNKSILNANLDIDNAKKKIWETTAIGLPQISAKGTFQYTPTTSPLVEQLSGLSALPYWMYKVDQSLKTLTNSPDFGNVQKSDPPEATNPNDTKWSLNGDITVSQLIFSGSYLVGLQSAKVYKSLSDLNSVKSMQDVMESVSNSYYSVLIARENAQILDSTYKNIEATLNQLKLMNSQGFNDVTDVDQLQITFTNIKVSLDFIIRQQDLAEKMLKLQLGVDLSKPIVLTDSLASLFGKQTYDQLLTADLMMEGNVTYQMLNAQVKISEQLLKLQKSACLPDVAAYYQHDKAFNTKAFNMNPIDVIGASISIPIFASGSRYVKIKQAQNDLLKARNSRDQASDGLRMQFYQSKSNLINARDKFTADKQNLELSEKIYKRSLIKYQNGVISSLELTQAQNQFLTSQSSYYQSILGLITEKNKLEKMLTKN